MAKIRIYYTVDDGGDGSAHPTFHKSRKEMEDYIKEQENDEYDYIDLSEGGSYRDIDVSEYEVVE